MTDWLQEYGEQLVDNGFPIIPIFPGTKKPGKMVGSGWTNFVGWQVYCNRLPNTMELKQWTKFEDGGVGIPCGKHAVAIDIDVLDMDLASAIKAKAFEIFGPTDAVRIGRAPKLLLVYRPDERIENRKHHPLEIISEGGQFVAYATHPDTGKPYQWPVEGLVDIDQGQLPAITQEQVDRFVAATEEMIPESMRPKRLRQSTAAYSDRVASSHGLEAVDRDALADALAAIPNDVDWNAWNDVGMALWAATSGGGDGCSLWRDFSSRNAAYDAEETDRRWNHFFRSPPSRIGAGSIYDIARRNGWTGSTTPKIDAALNVVDLAAILSRTAPDPSAVPKGSQGPQFPLDGLDGALGAFVAYCTDTATRPQPILAVAGGLAAIGAVMGRKYKTTTGLRSNLYCIGVASSASGKDHARGILNRIFSEATLQAYMGGSEIASGASLITALTRHPQVLFQWDEFGLMLKRMTASSGKDPQADVMTKLMKLFSEAQGVYYGTEYADQKSRPKQVIIQPCVSVHGTTTQQSLYQALADGNLSDGSLARFLFFPSATDHVSFRRVGSKPIPQGLTDAFAGIEAGPDDFNTMPMGNGCDQEPNPYTVPESAGAITSFDQVEEWQESLLADEKDEGKRSVYGRIFEHTAKVAMVKAVSRDPMNPVIEGVDVRWAGDVVAYCMHGLMNGLDEYYAGSEYERVLKKVRGIIKTSGTGGMTMTDLAKRTRDLDARKRNDIVAHLQEAGDVFVTDQKSGVGRPVKRIAYAG